jgi:diketogulonate reductase-like aldo/keto reductase
MRSRSLGTTGQSLPIVGQGTWNLERVERQAAIAALRAGLDAGMTHIDTAEMYGDGRVEHLVGEALAGRREPCVVVSKVLPQHADLRGTLRACDRSLGRLGLDHLDGYLLHWAGEIPLAETVEAFERLREAGKIRWWGVSNFDETQMKELVALAGAGAVACNQVLYHLRERSIEHAVLPYCHEQGIAVVGYSPFGSGHFPTGRAAAILQEIAARRGATARQVALAFLVREPGTFTIPRTAQASHARDNAGAGDLELAADELAAIDGAFARGPRRSGVPTL